MLSKTKKICIFNIILCLFMFDVLYLRPMRKSARAFLAASDTLREAFLLPKTHSRGVIFCAYTFGTFICKSEKYLKTFNRTG